MQVSSSSVGFRIGQVTVEILGQMGKLNTAHVISPEVTETGALQWMHWEEPPDGLHQLLWI